MLGNSRSLASFIERLRVSWNLSGLEPPEATLVNKYLPGANREIDRFDRVQLEDVLRICERSASLAQAGKQLFAVSRTQKKSHNDSDRIRKYLARFDLGWSDIH